MARILEWVFRAYVCSDITRMAILTLGTIWAMDHTLCLLARWTSILRIQQDILWQSPWGSRIYTASPHAVRRAAWWTCGFNDKYCLTFSTLCNYKLALTLWRFDIKKCRTLLCLRCIIIVFKWINLKLHIHGKWVCGTETSQCIADHQITSSCYIAECGLRGSNRQAHNLTICTVASDHALDPKPYSLAHWACSIRIQQNCAWKEIEGVGIKMLV